MSASPAPSIFVFQDYRAYMRAWFTWKKSNRPSYSRRAFALKATYSHTMLRLVLNDEKHLSLKSASPFAAAMGLSPPEVEHFRRLVEVATTHSAERRSDLNHQIMAAVCMHNSRDRLVFGWAYLAAWWIPVVRALASREEFSPDPGWIASQIRPELEKDQGVLALKVLRALDILEKEAVGKLTSSQATLVTPTEVDADIVKAYHKAMIDLARTALDRIPAEEAYYQTALLAVPVGLEARLRTEIRQFAERMVGMVEENRRLDGECVEKVLLLNVHLLPVTQARTASGSTTADQEELPEV